MNDTYPYLYWHIVSVVVLLALLSSYALYVYWNKPKSFKS